MRLQMIGCSHHHSSIAVRERLAFSPVQCGLALDGLRERFPQVEAVLLSTCNRVEIYTAAEDPLVGPSHEQVAQFMADFHQLPMYEIFDDLFERTGEDAVRHLFTVAASLDSMVVGEPQILAQVKQAYELAKDRQSTGPLTHGVFQTAVRVARRVTTETTLHQRRVSIPSVAVGDFASQIFERFDDKKILVIGAGEMGEETLRYLQDEGAHDVTVVNRSFERAEQLAHRWQGRAEPWERLPAELVKADLVISTTGASEPIVTLAQYKQIEAARYQRPLFILDLAIAARFRAGDRRPAGRVSLFDRRPASGLPAEPPRARPGTARGDPHRRAGNQPLHGRPAPSGHGPDHQAAERRLAAAERRRTAAAVQQAARAGRARPQGRDHARPSSGWSTNSCTRRWNRCAAKRKKAPPTACSTRSSACSS